MSPNNHQPNIFRAQHERFLLAWIAGVEAAGPSLFGCQVNKPSSATSWHQLTPKLDVMRKAISNKSQSDAAFIGIMAAFYNAEEAQKLLNKAGCGSFGFAISIISDHHRAIMADLIASFEGWQ